MPISVNKYSRKSFIKKLSFGIAGLLIGAEKKNTNKQDPNYFVLLSDTHIDVNEKHARFDKILAYNLKKIVNRILNQDVLPSGIIVNGDIARKKGKAGDYRTFRRIIHPLLEENISFYTTLGNHDNRDVFYNTLNQFKSDEFSVADSHVMVVESPNAYFILLDSLDEVNTLPGRLGQNQLKWLESLLPTIDDKPVILFAHHYPENGDNKGMLDYPQFREIITKHEHTKAFFYGHSHEWALSTKKGLYHVNIPSTAYTFKDEQPLGYVHLKLNSRGLDLSLDCLDRTHPWHAEQTTLNYPTLNFNSIKDPTKQIFIKKIYPNPFQTYTNISFQVLNTSYISIDVLTIDGRKVKRVIENERVIPGEYSVQFTSDSLASGNYIIYLKTKNHAYTELVTLVR